MKSENDVLKKFADEVAGRISRKAINALKKTTDTLSGEDSGLKSVWEDICVQVQFQESFFWDSYDEMARSLIRQYIEKLKNHEILALWFQTDEADEWNHKPRARGEYYDGLSEQERATCIREDEHPPASIQNVVEYIVTKHLYDQAGGYSNKRIRAYLDNR